MATPLLICDDSSLARKQIARSLPDNLAVEVSFATHGGEALDAIRAGKGDVLLLDLNMPVMDGYQVLEAIQREDLPTMVIVISGDIQPSAYQRVKQLGALDFIKNPSTRIPSTTYCCSMVSLATVTLLKRLSLRYLSPKTLLILSLRMLQMSCLHACGIAIRKWRMLPWAGLGICLRGC
ncbi:response regulator [Aliamphritea spongicola]|nr:response regulator [Aliamphritea spongicola]